MLKKLDWYIIKKFLSTFFFTVLIITMISIIIDFSDKVEDFIEEEGITMKMIFVDYYFNWILWINGLLFPLGVLIAVVFFTSRMAFNSEIISIFNAGISFRRLMLPYLVAGGFLTILHLAGNHYVIPRANETHYNFQHTYIYKHSQKVNDANMHLFVGPNKKIYVEKYNKRDTSARNLRIEKVEKNQLTYLFKAGSAKWIGEPNKWKFKDYEVRTFNENKESLLIKKGAELDTTLNLTHLDFIYYNEDKEMMTTPHLLAFMETRRKKGKGNLKKYETELHRRTAEPFTILILTIIGLAVAARKVRGGMGLHLAIGVGIGALYIFLSKFSITFATNETLPPMLGVWMPNIIFFIVAVYLVSKAQK
ncbi:MAG: LptF/LptG family permease [Saprospiraceae bacterium]